MRKKLKIIIPVLVLSSLAFMGYKIFDKISEKEKITARIQHIPNFSFINYKTGQIFTENSITQKKYLIIEYFHTECDICHIQAEQMHKQIDKFSQCELLFISNSDTNAITSFAKTYNLEHAENITFLHDPDFIFDDIFGKTGTPATFIYDKNRKLVKQFKGLVTANELIKYLEE
jgi:peroxiredoxin